MLVIRDVCPLCNSRCKKRAHYPAHVVRACGRKRAYSELIDAIDTARRVRAYEPGPDLHIYLCPLADHWHLTKRKPPQTGKRRR